MKRTKEEAAVTRQQIIKTALSVFSRKGYNATTLEDIAAEAGVTRGAIYWHFGGKAELYQALLAEYSARSGQVVGQAIAQGGSWLEICRRVFVALLVSLEEDAELRAVNELTLYKTELTTELEPSLRQQQATLQGLLDNITGFMAEGAKNGTLRTDIEPVEMARAFVALSNGLALLWLGSGQSFSLKSAAPAQAEIFLSGILRA